MAVLSHAFTIDRAAEILGRDEDFLWKLADQLEPEDGLIWILGTNDTEKLAFTPRGIETLQELIKDQIENSD